MDILGFHRLEHDDSVLTQCSELFIATMSSINGNLKGSTEKDNSSAKNSTRDQFLVFIGVSF